MPRHLPRCLSPSKPNRPVNGVRIDHGVAKLLSTARSQIITRRTIAATTPLTPSVGRIVSAAGANFSSSFCRISASEVTDRSNISQQPNKHLHLSSSNALSGEINRRHGHRFILSPVPITAFKSLSSFPQNIELNFNPFSAISSRLNCS